MAQQSKKKRPEDDQPPPDGAKPIQLQRRRVWRACESCRRKKIKCDGCEPTCSQCATSGSQCTWLQTKDRAALSRHYVQELEARLLHMESLFTQIAPALDGTNLPTGSDGGMMPLPPEIATPAAAILRTIAPKESPSPQPTNPVKIEDDVSESFGQLALDEHGHLRWIGGSSTMSLIQSFRSLTTAPTHRISPMEEDPLAPGPNVNKLYFPASVFFGKVHSALPGPEEVEYPERDLADKLVNAYFSRIHFLMPVLDKPSFLQQYNHVMNNIHDHNLARKETAFISLIFSVFACAASLVQDERLLLSARPDEGGMGMLYYERALILQYISHANTQVAHVQCFILLSSFLCSINCLPQAWLLVGQAVRTGQDLGLHRSPRRLTISNIEKETRRKIWWGVYTLDRMLAVALGRPIGINDTDCDVELPVEVDDENLPEYFDGASMSSKPLSLMTGSVAMIKLYQIGGRVLREVYALENCKDNLEPERKAELQRTVEVLDNELTQWCNDLPAVFKSQSQTDEQVSMGAVLCSHYYSMLTTLHRNFLPVKRDQLVTPRSTAKAVSSARSCIRLAPSMKNVVPPSHHLAFFIQHLFSSAVILLLYAMHANDPRAGSAAMEEAKSTLPALESWEGQWPGARKCKELLVELTSTATEAIVQGPKEEIPMTVPPSATTTAGASMLERRNSASSSSQRAVSRAMRSQSRRNPSRDPSTNRSRRIAAVSPYRVDTSTRARSSSRRRGLDDPESREHGAMGPYFQSFSSPTSVHPSVTNGGSAHSSPASGNLPSPITTVAENQTQEATSPTLAPGHTFNYGSPTLSSTQIPSPRYDYDYGLQSNLGFSGGQPSWNNNNGQGNNNGMFHNSQDGPSMSYNASPGRGYASPLDPMFPSFDSNNNNQDMNSSLGLSTTPPTSTFAAPGLPFRGLEFIRNYTSGIYSNGDNYMGEQESLWQSYDPVAFEYNPDLPFTLGDPDGGSLPR
ncbi:putative fungal-specific transcription factor [Dendrothele bispora CBS 962.96]|uniref:Putative fungal-specific transcription factor n=1 Tax=Dendrothele bispora (strain CBS 962.96) TaxID=1314807 RepID=A0A4S8MKF9_DENBC|nr:putative fungal-specific transcription factor [Dendrothele bispora CBS 962.96]